MNIAIVNCFDTYEHRVDLLHDFFISNGDVVKVYTSNFRHIEKDKRMDKKKDYVYVNTVSYYKNISPRRLLSHYKLAKDIFLRLEYQCVELLWVLVPPNSFVKEAANYKIRHQNVKLIFDIIDMWPETMPVSKIDALPPIKLWQRLRDAYISVADHIVTECELYQEKLAIFVRRDNMTTIYLARKVIPLETNPQLPNDKIVLCYLGSINNIIDIIAIKNLVLELKREKLVELHIIGDGEKRQELIDVSKNAGATVLYHGKIYDVKEKQRIFDGCHYGLNIMKESVYVGLTMKSIDYFEAGLPIINNIKGDTWKLVSQYNIGVNISDIEKSQLIPLCMERRKAAHDFYENRLSASAMHVKLEAVIERVREN